MSTSKIQLTYLVLVLHCNDYWYQLIFLKLLLICWFINKINKMFSQQKIWNWYQPFFVIVKLFYVCDSQKQFFYYILVNIKNGLEHIYVNVI